MFFHNRNQDRLRQVKIILLKIPQESGGLLNQVSYLFQQSRVIRYLPPNLGRQGIKLPFDLSPASVGIDHDPVGRHQCPISLGTTDFELGRPLRAQTAGGAPTG